MDIHNLFVEKSSTLTMKFWAVVLSALFLASESHAYSLYNPAKAKALSQKSVMQQTMGITRRETISMPSATPMVPYMVRTEEANE
jgi:hypothetical protein